MTLSIITNNDNNNNKKINKPKIFVLHEFILYTHHQKNSCNQKEVSDCNAMANKDKGYQEK